MAKQNHPVSYQCEHCKLTYLDEYWQQRCEEWCRENETCNLNITMHSLEAQSAQQGLLVPQR